MMGILPESFTVRPPTMDDVKTTTALVQLCDIVEYGDSGANEASQAAVWRETGETLQYSALLVFAPDGQLVGYARVRNMADVKFYTFIRVHPDYARTEIYSYLLRYMENFVRQSVPLAPEDARIMMVAAWIGETNRSMRFLFEQQGFSIVRGIRRMEIEMKQPPPEPRLPEGMLIRSLVPNRDERATFEANDEAFRDHQGHVPGNFAEWFHWTIEREDFDASLYFLACDNDQVAGVALCLQKSDLGWIDDLSVRGPWRRKGVGIALLQHTFREFYCREIYRVGLHVDAQNSTGAIHLYHRAGMYITRCYNTYEKEIRPGVELSV